MSGTRTRNEVCSLRLRYQSLLDPMICQLLRVSNRPIRNLFKKYVQYGSAWCLADLLLAEFDMTAN